MNKIIDRSGRLFGKVSVIDLVVVLLVAVMAFALNMKTTDLEASKTEGSDTKITFTVLVETLPMHRVDAIAVGDKVYDKDRASGGAVGTITAIERLPAMRVEQLSNGTFAQVTDENGHNLLVTIEGTGMVVNGRYSINRIYEIGINAARNFYTGYGLFTGSVVDIH